MSWSEPRTSSPFCFSMAASVAIAVPQTPMKWTRVLDNRRFLDDKPGPAVGHDARHDAERQGQGRPNGVTRGKPDDDRPGEVREQVGHHGSAGHVAIRLVAAN